MADFKAGDARRRSTPAEAKKQVLANIRAGMGVRAGVEAANRSYDWYRHARVDDAYFAEEVDVARKLLKAREPDDRVGLAGEFADFRRKYLFSETWPHQQCWVDLLEGGEPSWLHKSFKYEPGRSNRLLVNTPPNHAKSTTITMDYATYMICKNPDIRIIIVSKTQGLAKKFLYGIKSRLTHPRFAELQTAFSPEGGFKANADQWTANMVYLSSESRDGLQKDPTVEALGMGSHIYGTRADLVILDDCITLSNASDIDKQMMWLRQEVLSRVGIGRVLIIGTRVAANDLYKELRNPDNYADGKTPWTYFAQPAVLETADDPNDWVTLWPKAEGPFEGSEDDVPDAEGNYPRWTGPRLAEVRNDQGPHGWALVYQQQDVSSDSIFDPLCVRGSVNGLRKKGPLLAGAAGHPKNPEGFYRICSIDPAMAGDTAAVTYAVDRETRKRYVLDVHIMTGPTPLRIRELIYNWTELYKPHEWIIESNAFQLFLTQDEEIRSFLANKGIPLKGHFTGRNKVDPTFGVASMQPLFGTIVSREGQYTKKHNGDSLIELPDTASEGVKALVEQLVVWNPLIAPKNRKCDAVMALWFAELRAREVCSIAASNEQWYADSRFASQRDVDRRTVIGLDDWAQSDNTTMTHW